MKRLGLDPNVINVVWRKIMEKSDEKNRHYYL